MKNFRITGRISFGNWVIIAMLIFLAYSINNMPPALTYPAPQDYRICHAVSKFTADSIETDNGTRHGMMVSDIYPIGDTDGLFLLYSYIENAAPPAAEAHWSSRLTPSRMPPSARRASRFTASGSISICS